MIESAIIFAVLGLIGLGVLAVWAIRRHNTPKTAAGEITPAETLIAVTATESAARAARTLPAAGSEDRRNLLVPPQWPADEGRGEAAGGDQPNLQNQWLVRIEKGNRTSFRGQEVLEALDNEWLKSRFYPVVYGRAEEDGSWTPLRKRHEITA